MTKITTKLKCKACNLFYKDNGSISHCEKCGNKLKQIKIHTLKIKNIIVVIKKPKVKM